MNNLKYKLRLLDHIANKYMIFFQTQTGVVILIHTSPKVKTKNSKYV